MSRKHSRLVSMFERLCETLSECSITDKRSRSPHHLDAARRIREATEPLAISLLDEEIADNPAIGRTVYASASLELARHHAAITDGRVHLGSDAWSLLMISTTPSRVAELLDLKLFGANAVLPALRAIGTDTPDWAPLLSDRLSAYCLEAKEVREILDLRLNAKPPVLAAAADVLRRQVREHPAIMAQIARDCLREDDLTVPVALVLAGLDANVTPAGFPAQSVKEAAFVAALSSRHAQIALQGSCGPLERHLETLDGLEGIRTRVGRIFAQMKQEAGA